MKTFLLLTLCTLSLLIFFLINDEDGVFFNEGSEIEEDKKEGKEKGKPKDLKKKTGKVVVG